ERRPGRERRLRRGHRGLDVCAAAVGDPRVLAAGRGLVHRERRAVRGVHERAADEMPEHAHSDPVRPPSTGRFTPFTYDAAGDARNTIPAAISAGAAQRPSGTCARATASTSARGRPVLSAFAPKISSSRRVAVSPGNTLFTVMPSGPSSRDSVFAQFATAPRTVFDTPRPGIGSFTDVEITFTMRP